MPAVHEISMTLHDGMHFEADTGDGVNIHMDSDESVGGHGLGARPQKVLLAALAGCSSMDVISILRKKRQEVTGLDVKVRGEKAEDYPRVYTRIDLHYIVTGKEIDPEAVARSIELSMTKYCSVAGQLHASVPIHTSYEIVSV
ncbi:MAG: OsmC family protein [Anaerolineae bacterium]|nr:OsmC family protein [Anaerolineae bacterium]